MAKKRRITKESKMRLLFFGTFSVVIISYFIINTITMVFDIKSLSKEQQNLENNLVELQGEETNLNKELDKLKNDEYKARYAREYFLYSKEQGEYIFANILDEEDEIVEPEESQNDLYNYVIVAVISILLLVVLIILKRIRNSNRDE